MVHVTSDAERELIADYLTRLTSCDCDDCNSGLRWLCHPHRSKLLFQLQQKLSKMKRTALKRFSDNPFRDPNLTPEQVERIERRNRALRIYRETGDEGPAIEAGIFPKPREEETPSQ